MGLETVLITGMVLSAVTTGTTAVVSAKQSHDERKAMKNAAHDADVKQQELAQKAKEAEQIAKQEAAEKARKKQAAQTKTIYTSPLGISSEADIKKPTLLGIG